MIVDALLLVALAALLDRGRRLPVLCLGFLFAAAALYRVAWEIFPRYFGRPLALGKDIWLLPNLYDLVFDSLDAARAWLVILAAVVLFGIATLAAFWLLGRAARPLARHPRVAAVLALLAGCFIVAGVARSYVVELSVGLFEAGRLYGSRHDIDRELQAHELEALDYPKDLAGLGGADVYVFFIESYGRVLWRVPGYRERFEPLLVDFDARLEQAGIHTASHFVSSPVKGGSSWLAHTTFQSGVRCDNQITYERVLQSDVQPLSGYFRAAGYRTVSVMPAVDVEPETWPEGAYFQFDEHYWNMQIGYRGPRFDWSPIPDQFAIHAFHHARLAQMSSSEPLFVEFVLTSSHPPFRRVPPFYDGPPDIDAMLAFYETAPWQRFDNGYDRLNEAAAGYTAAIRYSLRSVLDYVLEDVTRPALVIILGDHQPITMIQGSKGSQVPMHVLSRDKALIEAFEALGFRSGLVARGGSRVRMSHLLELILRATSSDGVGS